MSTRRFTIMETGELGTCTCLHKRSCTSFYAISCLQLYLTKHGSHAYASLYAFPSTPIQASLFFACFTNLYKQRNIYKGLSTFVSFSCGTHYIQPTPPHERNIKKRQRKAKNFVCFKSI